VVFTLYRGATHPFIHALNTREAWAVCLDLPEIGHDDADAALDWGIAQDADGRAVFAVNATLGLAAAIDPAELSIRRATAFDAPRAAVSIELAKFGHTDVDPVGRRVVASRDGGAVFAAGAGGIVRLDTEQLTVIGRFLEGTAIEALALTEDATSIYALAHDGRILRVDAESGEILGQVPGGPYDRLVAMDSW
jgi:DNA-binding beta-propeller fold protein YncE